MKGEGKDERTRKKGRGVYTMERGRQQRGEERAVKGIDGAATEGTGEMGTRILHCEHDNLTTAR